MAHDLPKIPPDFVDSGCSNAPDSIFGRPIAWACRIHDWRYCTRAHPAGAMTQRWRQDADRELGANVRGSLPFALRWVGWVYWRATHRFGGDDAFDSCGPEVGERCRHNLARPAWMGGIP
jgi:hypothetical protein